MLGSLSFLPPRILLAQISYTSSAPSPRFFLSPLLCLFLSGLFLFVLLCISGTLSLLTNSDRMPKEGGAFNWGVLENRNLPS